MRPAATLDQPSAAGDGERSHTRGSAPPGSPESGAAEAADHGTHPPSGPSRHNPCWTGIRQV